jgi:hypothetical protein
MTSLAAIRLVAMRLGAMIPEPFQFVASGARRRGLAMVAPLAVVPLAIVCPGAAPGQFRFATLAAAYWQAPGQEQASMPPRMRRPWSVSTQA